MLDLKTCQTLAARMLLERGYREQRWRELSRWICPQRGVFDGINHKQPNRQDNLRFTEAASQACLSGASGLTSGMTPRNAAWFKPEFRIGALAELPGARQWLDSLDHLIRSCLASGGFYQAIHSFNMDLIWAGCALLFAEDSGSADEAALRYECPQVGSWAVTRDSRGRLNRVLRKLAWSVSDMAEVFGESKLDERGKSLLARQPLQQREICHLVLLGEGEGPLPVASYWWEAGGKDFLHVGGYREMPFFYTCWYEGETVYGTGPGDAALPDARQMDILERHKLEGLAKIINPPVSAPNHLKGHCNLSAGAVNYVPDRALITPIIDLNSFAASLPHLRQEIQTVTQRLERCLMASIFSSMPLAARPAGMSATEFLERKREALQQLGPVISAYEPHVLTPLLFRTMQALDNNGAVEPVPKSLQGLPPELTLDFISPMANALRQSTAESARALFGEVASIVSATGDRGVLDKIDLDQMVDEYAAGLGAPGAIVRADADVAQIRQQRARQEQAVRAMQLQAQAAQAAQAEAGAMNAQAQAAMAMDQASAMSEPDGINLLALAGG